MTFKLYKIKLKGLSYSTGEVYVVAPGPDEAYEYLKMDIDNFSTFELIDENLTKKEMGFEENEKNT